MYIQRDLEEKILKYINVEEILAIIGPRRAGKTTIINNILDKKEKNKRINRISFENILLLDEFENNIEDFIKRHIEGFDIVFIDEIQYSKNSGQKLKYIFDSKKNVKLIISGSSATEISLNSIKYLVGRIFVFKLFPLSFNEFLRFKDKKLFKLYQSSKYGDQALSDINNLLKEYLSFGGYPRVVLSEDDEEKQEVLENIFNTYLLKEVKEILQFKESHLVLKLVNILALQMGGIINYNDLSAKTGIAFKELKNILSILEKTFICSQLLNFHSNKQLELVKSPKIFFFDLGFRNVILKNFNLNSMTDIGNIYENFIFIQLQNNFEIKYWRTKGKAEVDFILEKDFQTKIPIEIKSKLNSNSVEKSFRSFIENYKPKNGYILSLDYEDIRIIDKTKVIFLPFVKFLSNNNY